MSLPRYIVLILETNNPGVDNYQCLEYVRQDDRAYLNLTYGGKFLSPDVKFEVVPPKAAGVVGVHLRCCSNGKYLALFYDPNYVRWVAAVADEPQEDHFQFSCTLFEPIFATGGQRDQVSFRNAQSETHIGSKLGGPGLSVPGPSINFYSPVYHTVVDWESIVRLPERIVLRGDNGNPARVKMCLVHFIGEYYVVFQPPPLDEDGGVDAVFTVHQLCNGDFFLRHLKLLKSSSCLGISTDGNQFIVSRYGFDDAMRHTDAIFRPLRIGFDKENKNKISIASVYNGNLWSISDEKCGFVDILECSKRYTMGSRAHFVVEDMTVFERKFFNIRYHVDRKVVYDESPTSLTMERVVNNGTNYVEREVKLSCEKRSTTHWKLETSVGVESSLSVELGVPLLSIGGSIEWSTRKEKSYQLEETKEESTEIENAFTAHVPPLSILDVCVMCTIGKCDIPFSYRERNLLSDGTVAVYEKHDGIFTCTNSYDIKVAITPIPYASTYQRSLDVEPAMTALAVDAE